MEERIKRGDLVQMFRTVSGKDKLNPAWWFRPAVVRREGRGCFN